MPFNYSIKGFSGGLSALAGLTLSYAGIKSFLSGVFTRAFTDWNLVDLALAGAIILFVFAILLIFKDMIDGDGWSRYEKKRAIEGLAVCAVLVIGSYVGAGYIGTYDLADPSEDQFRNIGYWGGGADGDNSAVTFAEPKYVTVAGADADDTYMEIRLNQTGFSFTFLRTIRGFNLSLSDDGVSSVQFIFYDGTDHNTLLNSADDEITITDEGTTTSINATIALTTILTWIADYTYDASGDRFYLKVNVGGDNDPTASQTFTWQWLTSAESDTIYYFILFAMIIGFAYPFFKVFNFTNNPYRGRRRYRRSYRNRRRRRRRRYRR